MFRRGLILVVNSLVRYRDWCQQSLGFLFAKLDYKDKFESD